MHCANPVALASLLAIIPMSAQSQEATVSESHQYVLDLGAGVQYQPKYPGSNEYILFPFPIIAVQRFFLPGFGQVVEGEEKLRAFYVFPSFDFIGERTASDSNELAGTETVDWALELGVGVGYRYDWLRGTVEVRQGINGHDGQVMELGMDVVTAPFESLQLNFGPRLSWASGDYMDTYFGVTEAEASASGSHLTAYDPGASFKTAGLEARAVYALSDTTRLHIRAGWHRFIGEAADSPIVAVGSKRPVLDWSRTDLPIFVRCIQPMKLSRELAGAHGSEVSHG
jgi:outer membrane scaffolding protein for murein synthesis (MipA/OmpV family)